MCVCLLVCYVCNRWVGGVKCLQLLLQESVGGASCSVRGCSWDAHPHSNSEKPHPLPSPRDRRAMAITGDLRVLCTIQINWSSNNNAKAIKLVLTVCRQLLRPRGQPYGWLWSILVGNCNAYIDILYIAFWEQGWAEMVAVRIGISPAPIQFYFWNDMHWGVIKIDGCPAQRGTIIAAEWEQDKILLALAQFQHNRIDRR